MEQPLKEIPGETTGKISRENQRGISENSLEEILEITSTKILLNSREKRLESYPGKLLREITKVASNTIWNDRGNPVRNSGSMSGNILVEKNPETL